MSIGQGTMSHLGLAGTGGGALLSLGGDDSQIRMANQVIHADNSGLTAFHIRNNYGATAGGALLNLESGTISLKSGTSFTERMKVTSSGTVEIMPVLNAYNFKAYGYDTDSFFGVRTDNNHSVILQADRSDGYTVFTFNGHTGNLTISGAMSKGSGSFKIDHPLPKKKKTHHLVHSFIEGPQADLIYRGKADLVKGKATVNIDTAAGMTDGTFVRLCGDVQCFTTNEDNWDLVKASVTGNKLKIESQNTDSTATISWLVIGERIDEHMKETDWTDDDGKVIVEPEKEVS